MTSIAHPVLPGAVPAVGGPDASPLAERLARPAGSKALRVGLGVAIAAVMAGDVYAVLRSPASEGRGVGSSSSTASLVDDGSAAGASDFRSNAGHVAQHPFSEAAWGASSGPGAAKPLGPVGAGAAPVAAAPAAATVPAAPSAPAATTIVLPAMPSSPASSALPTSGAPTGPATDGGHGGPTTPPPPPTDAPASSPLMQAVTPVLQTVEETVPQAAPVTQAVTEVVTEVDAVVPTQELAPVVEDVVVPVSSTLGLR